jgi:hypothetical protein
MDEGNQRKDAETQSGYRTRAVKLVPTFQEVLDVMRGRNQFGRLSFFGACLMVEAR